MTYKMKLQEITTDEETFEWYWEVVKIDGLKVKEACGYETTFQKAQGNMIEKVNQLREDKY